MFQETEIQNRNWLILITMFLILTLHSANGFSICTFQVAEGGDTSGLNQAVQSSFDVESNETKVDFIERGDGCTFHLTDSKGKQVFKVSSERCQKIKLNFELNLVGYSCSGLATFGNSAR